MHFDDLLTDFLGEFGRYQKCIYLLVCIPCIFSALNMFCWTFSGADIPFRCMGDTNTNSTTFDSQCSYVAANGSVFSCNGQYEWDNSEIPPSALQEWELVCDRKWYKGMVQSLYYVGIFFGSLVCGYFADRYGRKPVLMFGTMTLCGITALSVLSPNVEAFMVARFMQGFLEPCAFQIPVIMGIELVGPSRRLLGGMLIEFFFTGGLILLGILAYFIREWRTLQLVTSVPGLLIFVYFWLIPESPRWLLATGRKQAAFAVIRQAARINNVAIPDTYLHQLTETGDDEEVKGHGYSFLDLVRTPNMRKKTVIMCYCWGIVTLIYYGISLNPSMLAGDFYTTFIMAGAVELPTIIFLLFTLDLFGRRWLQAVGFLVCGLSLIIVVFIPETSSVAAIVVCLLAKLSVSGAFCIVYLYASEIFPTVLRSLAIGLTSTCARIGGIMSPFASIYMDASWRGYLLVSFGVCSVLAAMLTMFLPETTNRTLPETVADGEQFGKESYEWCPCLLVKRKTPYFEEKINAHLIEKEIGLGNGCAESA